MCCNSQTSQDERGFRSGKPKHVMTPNHTLKRNVQLELSHTQKRFSHLYESPTITPVQTLKYHFS